MIVYENTLEQFIQQCKTNLISKIVSKEMSNASIPFSKNEFNSWTHSLPKIAKSLDNYDIPKDINVAIEYKSLLNNSRIDFIVYGENEYNNGSLVVVELKQWSKMKLSNKPNYVFTVGGGGVEGDFQHPSYQSLRYASMLKGFNEYVQENNVEVNSCSYCHNMDNIYEKYISNDNIYPFVTKSPIYLKNDSKMLCDYVKKHIKKPSRVLLYDIDNSHIRPSKEFSNLLFDAIKGDPIFSLDDGQSESVATIVYESLKSIKSNKRKTIIIKGGPGTGKSIVALNAIGQLLHNKECEKIPNCCYCTSNYTPKELLYELLTKGVFTKTAISNIFKGLAAFSHVSECEYDCVMFDEAHRNFKWKYGQGVKKTVDMIDRAFYASRVNVWFIDENQVVTKDDYLTIERIKKYAKKYDSEIIESKELSLTSQFRCMGGKNYIDFINYFLGYKESTKTKLRAQNYDFRVFDSPTEMYELIKSKQLKYKDARLLSGYTFEWNSKHDDTKIDFDLDDGKFLMKWNKKIPDSYILDESQLDRIGCIHTIQGVDMSYAGVIIGDDMIYRNGKICFDKSKNAKTDTASGIRTANDELAEIMIRNTYKVLLTRAIYGTYVYCVDKELNEYLKTLL